MRTVVLERYGEPKDVLQVREAPVPEPGPGQVRVRMLASPINPSDLLFIRGQYAKPATLPATPGFEGVGVVDAAGPSLLGAFLRGRRVALINRETGNWREYTIVSAKQTVPISKSIPLEQAAMFFVNPMTAFAMTRRVLKVAPGEWLLQTAANSALGKMVIRLGARFGFKTLNIVRRQECVAELKDLGGTEVVACQAGELIERVAAITGGRGVRCAIDPVGGAAASAVVRCLAPGGRLLLYGTLTADPITFSPRDLMTPAASVEGFWLARWMNRLGLWQKLRLVRSVSRLVREGVLTAEIGRTFDIDAVTDAVTAAEQPGRKGKILLRFAGSGDHSANIGPNTR
jgi:NADPH:quinone reductase-like Zn-dependent oxidoreductase